MNYSTIVHYKKNNRQAVFRRVLISWVIILLIGLLIGFFIGRSTKSASALPVITQTPIPSPTVTPYIKHIPTPEPDESIKELTTELVSLGEFRITAYCPCEICCGSWGKDRPTDEDGNLIVYTASGDLAVECMTIAADTNILPFGTEIIMDGNKYIVQDRGKTIKGNRIDVYFESHQDAMKFGVQCKEVLTERMIEK